MGIFTIIGVVVVVGLSVFGLSVLITMLGDI